MKVLFYVDPLIELGQPYWKIGWASYCAFRMAKALNTGENDFYIALNEAVDERFLDVDHLFTKVVFSQKDLLRPFPGGYLEASTAWYTHRYTEVQMLYYIRFMKDKFSPAAFDLIITYTPVPFLVTLYPNARILYMEYSLFSRKPFPQTWYLDCCGMFEHSFLSQYQKEIGNIQLDEKQTELVRSLRESCVQCFERNNVFQDEIQNLRNKFKYLVLLPLQFSGYYAFDCLTKYKNQFDFLCGCLDEIPEDIGVIFTMHPQYPILREDAIHYITVRYKHAVFLPNSKIVASASQWMLPYVDGVVTVSSSLGLQTLLFKKKLFAIGNRNMDYIADANNLHNMHQVLSKEPRNKEHFLYFIVTKYAISEKYLFNAEWLQTFIKKSCTRSVDQKFYDLIDAPEKIFAEHIETIHSDRSGFVPTMLTMIQGVYTETYRFEPKEFSITGADEYDVTFCLQGRVPEKFLRIDPLEGHRCSMEVLETETDAAEWQMHSSNAFSINNDTYIFFTEDPILYFFGDFINACYLKIRYKLKILDSIDALSLACQEEAEQARRILAEVVREKERQIAEAEQARRMLAEVVREKERQIAENEQQIALYENSISWKITAPLRKLKQLF